MYYDEIVLAEVNLSRVSIFVKELFPIKNKFGSFGKLIYWLGLFQYTLVPSVVKIWPAVPEFPFIFEIDKVFIAKSESFN